MRNESLLREKELHSDLLRVTASMPSHSLSLPSPHFPLFDFPKRLLPVSLNVAVIEFGTQGIGHRLALDILEPASK